MIVYAVSRIIYVSLWCHYGVNIFMQMLLLICYHIWCQYFRSNVYIVSLWCNGLVSLCERIFVTKYAVGILFM